MNSAKLITAAALSKTIIHSNEIKSIDNNIQNSIKIIILILFINYFY